MNKFDEINGQYSMVQKQMRELKEEYKDKKRGQVYQKRYVQLIKKLESFQRKAFNIGAGYLIAHVRGKRRRPSRKNPQISVIEGFNLYFVGVTEEEVSLLVKLHVKNMVEYTIRFIKSGLVITTRN